MQRPLRQVKIEIRVFTQQHLGNVMCPSLSYYILQLTPSSRIKKTESTALAGLLYIFYFYAITVLCTCFDHDDRDSHWS